MLVPFGNYMCPSLFACAIGSIGQMSPATIVLCQVHLRTNRLHQSNNIWIITHRHDSCVHGIIWCSWALKAIHQFTGGLVSSFHIRMWMFQSSELNRTTSRCNPGLCSKQGVLWLLPLVGHTACEMCQSIGYSHYVDNTWHRSISFTPLKESCSLLECLESQQAAFWPPKISGECRWAGTSPSTGWRHIASGENPRVGVLRS